eukprot:1266956-Rhodomonas_salina.1
MTGNAALSESAPTWPRSPGCSLSTHTTSPQFPTLPTLSSHHVVHTPFLLFTTPRFSTKIEPVTR